MKLYGSNDINNLYNHDFLINISKGGYQFLIYYINNAVIDDVYKKRLNNVSILNNHKIYDIDDIGITEEDVKLTMEDNVDILKWYQDMNKVRIISAIGVKNFIKQFYFGIQVDLMYCEMYNLPEHIKVLEISKDFQKMVSRRTFHMYMNDNNTVDVFFSMWKYFCNIKCSVTSECNYISVDYNLILGKNDNPDNFHNVLHLTKLSKECFNIVADEMEDYLTPLEDMNIYGYLNSLCERIDDHSIVEQLHRSVLSFALDHLIYFYVPTDVNDQSYPVDSFYWTEQVFYCDSSEFVWENKQDMYDYIIERCDLDGLGQLRQL